MHETGSLYRGATARLPLTVSAAAVVRHTAATDGTSHRLMCFTASGNRVSTEKNRRVAAPRTLTVTCLKRGGGGTFQSAAVSAAGSSTPRSRRWPAFRALRKRARSARRIFETSALCELEPRCSRRSAARSGSTRCDQRRTNRADRAYAGLREHGSPPPGGPGPAALLTLTRARTIHGGAAPSYPSDGVRTLRSTGRRMSSVVRPRPARDGRARSPTTWSTRGSRTSRNPGWETEGRRRRINREVTSVPRTPIRERGDGVGERLRRRAYRGAGGS